LFPASGTSLNMCYKFVRALFNLVNKFGRIWNLILKFRGCQKSKTQ
jgi:hypothetical protein